MYNPIPVPLTEYLEGNGVTDNAVLNVAPDSIDQFIQLTPTSDEEVNPYNDNFVTITREELWAVINRRNDFTAKMTDLTEALAMCLSEYVNNHNYCLHLWRNQNEQIKMPPSLMVGI